MTSRTTTQENKMTIISAPAAALEVIALIKDDMADRTIPASVTSFAELHDYVDANEYLIAACYGGNFEAMDPASEELAARDNKVMDIVNVWLAGRR